MSFGLGSLQLSARRAGVRTVLERVRYDGITRCSRAFTRGDAALVVLSQLGPGVVRGDDVSTIGHLRADAHLIVTSQTATRVMGGPRASRSRARWTVDDGATLDIVGEPLLAAHDARYEATTAIELGRGSLVLLSEVAAVPSGAAVRLRTVVQRAGREFLYDAFDAGAAAPHAVGTLALIGLPADQIACVLAALDAVENPPGIRCGVGALAAGLFARMLAHDVWALRSHLMALRTAVSATLISLAERRSH